MEYEVLNPWADADPVAPRGILPRVADLNSKTIGLFSHFKASGLPILQEVERQLKKKFPKAKFIHLHYPGYKTEIAGDPEYKTAFEEWVGSIDIAVTGYGD